MTLKFNAIIITLFTFETYNDLMAGLDNENGESQSTVKFRPVVQNESHREKRVSICLDWPDAYAAMHETEPSALPIWTREPTPRYETPQYVQEYMAHEDELRADQGNRSRVKDLFGRILKSIQLFRPLKRASTVE